MTDSNLRMLISWSSTCENTQIIDGNTQIIDELKKNIELKKEEQTQEWRTKDSSYDRLVACIYIGGRGHFWTRVVNSGYPNVSAIRMNPGPEVFG